ncbi:ATP-binding protein [Desulfobacterales bacterium HSG17]|nr:ATP-binding protein [Desulfobacterales bacterium HSG17]
MTIAEPTHKEPEERIPAFEETQESYKRIVNKTKSGLMIVDKNGIVQFANPSMKSLLSFYGELPGNQFGIPLTSNSQTEVRTVLEDGSLGNAEMDVTEITWENEQCYLVMLHDITDQKKAEIALELERASLAKRVEERTRELSAANAKLERTARLKDEFLANMSHELRTPLTSILGMTEALQEQVFGPMNEKELSSLNRIEQSGRHLLNLINDILDLSKIEAGKIELDMTRISVEAICRTCINMIKQQTHKKRIKLNVSIDKNLKYIRADMLRLKQILVNLLNNAVKFTPEEGEINLNADEKSTLGTIEFTVQDTGIGIPEKDMETLFQPFVQVDGSKSRHHEGTGLGLSLVSRLTEMHGGSVSLISKMGQGSQFTVSLPLDSVPQNEKKQITVENPQASSNISCIKNTTILLTDDNQSNIETLGNYLSAKGCQVITAGDGYQALQQAKEKNPDIILMDIQMPGMDGMKATRRIRADKNLKHIPVIALTALAMPDDREQCIKAGANEYMAKPVKLKKLVEMIEKLLKTERKQK